MGVVDENRFCNREKDMRPATGPPAFLDALAPGA